MKKIQLLVFVAITFLSGCSASELYAGPNFQFYDALIVDGEEVSVYRHDKTPNYWAEARSPSILCCTDDPDNFKRNVEAIEVVSGCPVDDTYTTHNGLLTTTFVTCNK